MSTFNQKHPHVKEKICPKTFLLHKWVIDNSLPSLVRRKNGGAANPGLSAGIKRKLSEIDILAGLLDPYLIKSAWPAL